MADDSLDDASVVQAAHRLTSDLFKKYDAPSDCQELLAHHGCHWLLTPPDELQRHVELPSGLISKLVHVQEHNSVFLMPEVEKAGQLDFREVHQIITELTIGIYVLNQIPTLSLEANFDASTTCLLPPAYQDTRVGRIMINVDYMMKSLWHGVYMQREKRTKFAERWRTNLDVNSMGKPDTKKPLLMEFTSAGMLDITKDPDYKNCYEKVPIETAGSVEQMDDKRFFMNNAEDMAMQLTFFQKSVQQMRNLFVLDPHWIVSSVLRLPEDKLDQTSYERLSNRLRPQQEVIREHLTNKVEICHQMELLKFISFMVPFLVGMKKKMKIPDLSKMLKPMTGDECKTERELPPIMLSSDFNCKNFSVSNMYFHLHGGVQYDVDTPSVTEPPPEISENYKKLQQDALSAWMKIMDPEQPSQETYPVPVETIGGKNYHVISIEFEQYLGIHPQRPRWVLTMCEEINHLKPEKLKPLNDKSIHDIFKKHLGKKAIKVKGPQAGMIVAAQRNHMMVFQSFIRKTKGTSRLNKADDQGYTLMHHAAIHNRPYAIGKLVIQNQDVDVRRSFNILSQGVTPLHLAARVGALETVGCLLGVGATVGTFDSTGWAAIHHAAFFNHEPCLRLLIHKDREMLEYETKNETKSTPLLLAASSGGLDAVRTLIQMTADIKKTDANGNNLVNLASLSFHTNVLEYLILWGNKEVPVWDILVAMLRMEDISMKEASVRCLEVLSTSSSENWEAILKANGIPALVELLRLEADLNVQNISASTICNISEKEPIKQALTKCDAGPVLIKLLSSDVDDIQSRAAIILADLACVEDNQNLIAEQGGIPPLVTLLDSELEDVLVNAVNAVRVMCTGNRNNQLAVVKHGGIEPLVEFLVVNSDILQAASSAAIAELVEGNKQNQDAVIAEGCVEPLVKLVSGRNITVQVKAARAIEALAANNPQSQKAFLDLDAPKALIRLLKIWQLSVKEQGALSLWALAGHTKPQQKYIAERISFQQLIDMVLLKSEKLQFVGGQATISLCRENFNNQTKICEEGGISPLIRLLRATNTSERVLLTVIRVLGALCIGVAHRNNKVTQKRIAEEGGIKLLVDHLLGHMIGPPSDDIKVEVACTLACVVLGNAENQTILKEQDGFNFKMVLTLMESKNEEIHLRAGNALSIFAFNNTPQQYAIRDADTIRYDVFKPFLESDDEFKQCDAAFQIVVLARVIRDVDQVVLTAKGVTTLVNVLNSETDNVVILAASCLASLAHTRAGIPDAMYTSGAIELLIPRLNSDDGQVRCACAVALGYLTFNRTAARALLVRCRNTPGLYEKLARNIDKDAKISQEFVGDFKRACIVGLPALSLEANGGPPAIPPPSRGGKRPQTSMSYIHQKTQHSQRSGRASSAPAFGRAAKYGAALKMGQDQPLSGGKGEPLSLDLKKASVSSKSKTIVAWQETK